MCFFQLKLSKKIVRQTLGMPLKLNYLNKTSLVVVNTGNNGCFLFSTKASAYRQKTVIKIVIFFLPKYFQFHLANKVICKINQSLFPKI
jgi:hypothetical protein